MVITGLGNHTEKAESCGMWAGTLVDNAGTTHDFSSFGTYVPSSKFSLISVAQMTHGGNAIVHYGDPVTGTHGMFLASPNGSQQFVPFVFCKTTGLWWLKIYRNYGAYSLFLRTGQASNNARVVVNALPGTRPSRTSANAAPAMTNTSNQGLGFIAGRGNGDNGASESVSRHVDPGVAQGPAKEAGSSAGASVRASADT